MTPVARESRWSHPPQIIAFPDPSSSPARIAVKVDASIFRPQRIYGSAAVRAPIWPDSLETLYRERPRQSYAAEERALGKANRWAVLRSGLPERFGTVPFADVLRVLQCPRVFVDASGECEALLVYGSLLRGEPLPLLGDVVIDLLPWPEPAFLIRPAQTKTA